MAPHNQGSGWECTPTLVGTTLQDVWVHGPSLAFAVGDLGTILRWDGSSWSVMLSGTLAPLYSVWGSGPTDVWIAGDSAILHKP